MDEFVQSIIDKIEAGESVNVDDYTKNQVNAIMAGRLKEGNRVQVIATGETGIVVGKIKYNRELQDYFSPNGYTAIRVKTGKGTYSYAGRSLRPIKKEREDFAMGKLKYGYEGVVYEVNRELTDKWLEREGITENTLKYHNAMICVITNARGRLALQGIEPEKEAMQQVMEELIREEIQLTGGEI